MSQQRLADQYPVNTLVEISLPLRNGDRTWVAGRVIGHDHPGMWVQINMGQQFFVTNTRRVRAAGAF